MMLYTKTLYYDPKEHQYYVASGEYIDLSTNSNFIQLNSLHTNYPIETMYLTDEKPYESFPCAYAGAISNLRVYTNGREDLSNQIFVKTLTPESFVFESKNMPIPVLLTNEYSGLTEYIYIQTTMVYTM